MTINTNAASEAADGGACPDANWPVIGEVFDNLTDAVRWVVWRPETRDGKPTKVPYVAGPGRANAKTNDPMTWRPLAAAKERCAAGDMAGPGLMLGRLEDGRWLVGFDFDLCRNPRTGAIEPWALRIIRGLATYGEVSPSGTGVKLFGIATELPPALWDGSSAKGLEATPPGASVPEGAAGSGHTVPEIGIYPGRRYFTVTGQHLHGTPDEITDVTEALAEIAHEVAGWARGRDAAPATPIDWAKLPPELAELLAADPTLAAAFERPTKLTKGRDHSASGLDFSLAIYLAEHGADDATIATALRHHLHGQIGGGTITGTNADRRIEKLLREAEKARGRAERWRDIQAWWPDLICSEKGEPRDCIANGCIILRQEPTLAGRTRFDEHRQRPMGRDLPWRPGGEWRDWTNTDDIRLAEWCQLRGVPLRSSTCAEAVAAVADDNRVHPIREYLEGLEWDGTPRLDRWLSTHLGAVARGEPQAVYLRQVGRRWPISAVARIYRPGCKADHGLIIEGGQGIGKSTALAALTPTPEWFTDEIADLGSKDAAQDITGKWIIELGELSALKRGDVERVKAFMSRSTDHYRPSYGRRSQDFPRQCVFAGTTNADAYLADETGNRRFWPVKVGKIDIDAIQRDRDQLWAEAVHAFKAAEKWWLDREVEQAAAEEQAERRITDPWEELVLPWLVGRAGDVTIADIMQTALGLDTAKRDQPAQNRVARILRANGWERVRVRILGERGYVYRRVSPLSPVGEGPSGDKDDSISAPVPTVPTVPSKSGEPRRNTPPPLGNGGHGVVVVPTGSLRGNGGASGDSGDSAAGYPRATPAWSDDRSWIDRYRRAQDRAGRVNVVLEWARAAGGTVQDGEALALRLPADLPSCLAAVELRRVARDLQMLAT
jgi:hypothetical protein